MEQKDLPTQRPLESVADMLAADKSSPLKLTPALIKLYALLAPACLVVCATNGYDGSVLTGLQGVDSWKDQFNNPRGALLGFTSAAYPLGAILSTPFSAFVSDRFGRKMSILVGSSIMIIGVIIQCVSKSIGLFIGGRIVVGRNREAYATLAKCHGDGDWDHPLVRAEYFEMHDTLEAEREMTDASVSQFFKSPANRHRLIILVSLGFFVQWSGNGLVSYYLTKILASIGISTQEEQTKLVGTLATFNYGNAIVAAMLSAKLARRTMFVGGGIAMFLSFSALTISISTYNELHTLASSKSALAFIFIYNASYNVCLNPLLWVYPTEILPYRLRAKGLSILVLTTKAASFFNQFVNPIGMDTLGWKYYIVYVVWLLVEIAVFYFLYPETRGLTLEKAQAVFGDAPETHVEVGEKAMAVEIDGTPDGKRDA
ncbi:hypothetical protein CEP52_008591 [Fusarium oligoseptatum]|uniref:Major facilitator superfamily (MFS) profile domain-containing protein n=1 Tax=Fusarium oligoseptatum TaxID=2604345 RepID=A0A428TH29_9HYPO|nr:hypothetical protein CEP52_008591 [Fusarium oligoseptatum]